MRVCTGHTLYGEEPAVEFEFRVRLDVFFQRSFFDLALPVFDLNHCYSLLFFACSRRQEET